MGRWLDGAEPREIVRASHTRGFLNVGGRLAVTESHVVFLPMAPDRWLGRRPWTCPIAEVEGVGVSPRGRPGRLFGGGIRRRLVIHHANGSEYFVVTDVEWVVSRFAAELGVAGDGAA